MKKIFSRMCSKRGETLVEMLVSILLLALAMTILMTLVMASYRMNEAARGADETFYEELKAAEEADVDDSVGSGRVIIKFNTSDEEQESFDVNFYGGEEDGSLRSYRLS